MSVSLAGPCTAASSNEALQGKEPAFSCVKSFRGSELPPHQEDKAPACPEALSDQDKMEFEITLQDPPVCVATGL